MYNDCGTMINAGSYNPVAIREKSDFECCPPPPKTEDIRTIMSEVHDLVVDIRGMLFTINTELQGYENTEKQPDMCVNNMLDLVKKVRMDASSVRAEAAKLAKVLGV